MLFVIVLSLGICFVLAQAIAAWHDGFFTRAQLHTRGSAHGWSFLEHGGMWADTLIVSPVVAYIVATHNFIYDWRSAFVLGVFICIASILGYLYVVSGRAIPQPHAHDNKTTFAGWVHNVYTVLAMWTVAMLYSNLVTPKMSATEAVILSTLLTLFFILGVVKFSRRWRISTGEVLQVASEVVILWVVTISYIH